MYHTNLYTLSCSLLYSYMFSRFRSSCINLSLLSAFLLLPFIASASGIDDLQAKARVTRGEFLRAAIQELEVPTQVKGFEVLPYKRIPRNMALYVRIAHDNDALRAFGDDLRLSFPVTRGEALRVVVDLLDAEPSGKRLSFRDVRRGTIEEKAIRVGVEREWMRAKRNGFFGVGIRLRGSEAANLLENVLEDSEVMEAYRTRLLEEKESDEVQNIKIRIGNNTTDADELPVPGEVLMKTIWKLLNEDFLYEDRIDEEEAAYRAVEAIMESMDDQYTRFLRPRKARNFATQINGSITGIGAQVEEHPSGLGLRIVTPLIGSPAKAAGVKPNDHIIAVDGESLKDLEFMDAVDKVRGPKGSVVELTIRRDGIELKLSVTRDVIRVPEIDIKWQQNMAIVQLLQFGRQTETELRGKMEEVMERNPDGIVLDLRNNPGGLLKAANAVMSNFVPEGSIVAHINARKEDRISKTNLEPTIDADVPLVVLVNDGSASASEIVAGSLQDHDRATIVGEKTYGKGTVQTVLGLSDGSSIKMTIAEWLTPEKRKIDGEGVMPDVVVEYTNERDTQLLRAIEILQSAR